MGAKDVNIAEALGTFGDFLEKPTPPAATPAKEVQPEDKPAGKKKQPAKKKRDEQEQVLDINDLFVRKPRFEERFTRVTFFLYNPLVEAIDEQAKKWGKGEKTRLLNLGVQMALKQAAREDEAKK